MKKEELKRIIKPLIKECVKEALFEEGVLSNIISECVQGIVSGQSLIQERQYEQPRYIPEPSNYEKEEPERPERQKGKEKPSTKDALRKFAKFRRKNNLVEGQNSNKNPLSALVNAGIDPNLLQMVNPDKSIQSTKKERLQDSLGKYL